MGNRGPICGASNHHPQRTPGCWGRNDAGDPDSPLHGRTLPDLTQQDLLQAAQFHTAYLRRPELSESFSFGGQGYGPSVQSILDVWDRYELSVSQQFAAVASLDRSMAAALRRLYKEIYALNRRVRSRARHLRRGPQSDWFWSRAGELDDLEDRRHQLEDTLDDRLGALKSAAMRIIGLNNLDAFNTLDPHFQKFRRSMKSVEEIQQSLSAINHVVENSGKMISRAADYRQRLKEIVTYAKGVALTTAAERLSAVSTYTDRTSRLNSILADLRKFQTNLKTDAHRQSLRLYARQFGLVELQEEMISVANGSIPFDSADHREIWKQIIDISRNLIQ